MRREFTIGTAWTAAASWTEQAASAVLFVVIARLIGAEAFGVAAMAFAFLFLGETMVRDTITEAIVERASLEEGRLEATFVALIGLSLVIVVVLAAAAHLAATFYHEPQVAPLLLVGSPSVVMLAGSGVSTALLRRRLAYRSLAIRTILGVVAGGAIGVLLAANNFGAWSLVGQRLAQSGTNALLAISAARWFPRRWPKKSEFLLIRGLGPQVMVLRTITLVLAQTPTVALGVFANPQAVGMYAFSARLIEIVLHLVVNPIKGVAQSALAAMRRQTGSTAQFFLDLAELAALAGFSAFVGLALVARPAIEVLMGPEWKAAAPVLALLCGAGALTAVTSIQESYLLAIDKLQKFMRAALLELFIGLVCVGLASRFGPVMAAGAVVLRTVVALPLRTAAALAPEVIPVMRFVRAIAAPALIAAGMALIVGVWRIASLGRIPDAIFVGLAIPLGVAGACALLFGLTPGVAARLRAFIKTES
ncbi:MAG: oligosaccharide flippase family protein [Parvularculaceae bacterium]